MKKILVLALVGVGLLWLHIKLNRPEAPIIATVESAAESVAEKAVETLTPVAKKVANVISPKVISSGYLTERASKITDTGAVAIPKGARVEKVGTDGDKILVTDGKLTLAIAPDTLSEKPPKEEIKIEPRKVEAPPSAPVKVANPYEAQIADLDRQIAVLQGKINQSEAATSKNKFKDGPYVRSLKAQMKPLVDLRFQILSRPH